MTDQQLHEEILAELAQEPGVHPERIGVSVENGVVTLSGHTDGYSQKLAVERVVKRVYSAKAVVDDLEVRLPARDEVPDTDLAQSVVLAVEALSQVPADSVRVTVRDGHVRLDGQVNWRLQRQAVENAVRHLRGVRGLANHITIAEPEGDGEASAQIEATFPAAFGDESEIAVEISDQKVTLHGHVVCLREPDQAR